MQKNEVAGFMIMESTMDPVKPRNLQVFDSNGLFYVKFDAWLQEFNKLNRNRRNYESGGMMTSLHAEHIQELIRNKTWMGEAGHPHTSEPSRIMTIDPKLTSHRINKFNLEGNLLKGEVETLDNGIYGTQMTKSILQGMEPAFSLRALASLIKKGDGTSIVRSRSHIVTYDWVILPSHDKAYRDKSRPVEKILQSIKNDGNTVTESSIQPLLESQILSYIKDESINANLVSNLCEVALESMTLTDDLRYVILKESGQTYAVKVEDRIKHDIRSYMSSL